jgi:dipeptidyl aminopeptidase/acylaminoacyl peptidase
MTDEQLERRLRDWYRSEIPADETAPIALRSRVAIIPRASASRGRFASRRGLTLLAAAALTIGIVGGALIAGSGIVKLPSVVPPSVARSADPSVEPSAELPSGAPSVPAASSGLIAYVKFVPLAAVGGDCDRGATSWWDDQRPKGCSRIWVSNTDGTDAHELMPDHRGYQTPLSWSRDGTRLLFEDAAGVWLADASGAVLHSVPFDVMCPVGCPTVSGYELSPDGATIAFARPPVTTRGESVIALVDVATRHVTELASTAADENDAPHWSPDGTRLTFARQLVRPTRATLFMVDFDGSNMHQYVPLNLNAIEPRWSPDGSLIAFANDETPETPDGKEIYVVRPDGSGLRRLTSDHTSSRPQWTADGRLVFAHGIGDPSALTGFELWIMDADGANKAKLPVEDVAQLTAAHCVACAWVRDPGSEIPITEFMINALWQPTP